MVNIGSNASSACFISCGNTTMCSSPIASMRGLPLVTTLGCSVAPAEPEATRTELIEAARAHAIKAAVKIDPRARTAHLRLVVYHDAATAHTRHPLRP